MLSARLLNWVVGLLDVALLLLRSGVSGAASADEWLLGDEAPLPPTKRHLIMIDHNCARTKNLCGLPVRLPG